MNKNYKILTKRILVVALLVVFLSGFTTAAFALELSTETGQEQAIAAILEKINAEYGTSIRPYTDEELVAMGINDSVEKNVMNFQPIDLEEFESQMRHTAEVKIPEYERLTREASLRMKELGISDNDLHAENYQVDSAFSRSTQVVARKPITYATAGTIGSIIQGLSFNIWGAAGPGFCETNFYQRNWFLSGTEDTKVSIIDGGRTIHWQGFGDYGQYINGVQYYVGSGTQYAEFYASDYR